MSVGPYPTHTDGSGNYDILVRSGRYAVSGSAYGYVTGQAGRVTLPAGRTVNHNLPLTPLRQSTISGVVTDGSGHGRPLYARITVDGGPGGPVYTDPGTGRYTLRLPQHGTYQLHVTSVYKGYIERKVTVVLGATNRIVNVPVPIDAIACTAAGYTAHNVGTTQRFDGDTVPTGWSVVNGTSNGGWKLTDPAGHGNVTGGSGGYAIVDGGAGPSRARIDTTLRMPAADFTSTKIPMVSFDTHLVGLEQLNSVELSVDGGTTWTVPWRVGQYGFIDASRVDLFLTRAAGQANVLVRFHFLSTGFNGWWEVDNVFVGRHTCDLVPGGLVLGVTDDANTHAAVNGATIASVGLPAIRTISAATPDDANLGDGFYWFFSPATAALRLTASRSPYATATAAVTVTRNAATRADFDLNAGQITVTPGAIVKTVATNGTTRQTVTVTNAGAAPATVHIGSRSGAFNPLVQLDAPWVSVADYPTPIQDNGAAFFDGKLYAGLGYDGHTDTAALYVYDPRTGAWTTLAPAADARSVPVFRFLGRKLYVVGGSNEYPYGASGSAVLNGKLYVVGGCVASACGPAEVEIYDPAANRWTAGTPYPERIAWPSCGTIAGSIYCAGGSH